MFRDDHEAARARLDNIERELQSAQQVSNQDKQRIAVLAAELNAARAELARRGAPIGFGGNYHFAPRASAILTLGILSIVVCGLMGPIAWTMGNEELRRIDAGLTPPFQRGSAQAGRICGIISSSLLLLGLLFAGIGFFAFATG